MTPRKKARRKLDKDTMFARPSNTRWKSMAGTVLLSSRMLERLAGTALVFTDAPETLARTAFSLNTKPKSLIPNGQKGRGSMGSRNFRHKVVWEAAMVRKQFLASRPKIQEPIDLKPSRPFLSKTFENPSTLILLTGQPLRPFRAMWKPARPLLADQKI